MSKIKGDSAQIIEIGRYKGLSYEYVLEINPNYYRNLAQMYRTKKAKLDKVVVNFMKQEGFLAWGE